MEILRIVLTVLFVIDCIGLTVIILMQEGKSQGLGTIAGMADTYWGRNKGHDSVGGRRCSYPVDCGIPDQCILQSKQYNEDNFGNTISWRKRRQ